MYKLNDNGVLYREVIGGQTGNVPGTNLHRISQGSNQREVLGTGNVAVFQQFHPDLNLILGGGGGERIGEGGGER